MKYILIAALATFALSTCTNKNPNNSTPNDEEITDHGSSQDDPDLIAINDVIHGFYIWYEANIDILSNFNYVKGGKSTTLDHDELNAFYTQLKKSGFISQAFIDADEAYLENLEATVWKNENANEEPLTGLDHDRFFCAQDYDLAFWTTAPIGAEGLGTDKATATMSGMEGGSERTQQFELKKENGKWLISKILCE